MHSLSISQSFLVFLIRSTYHLNLLRSNCIDRKSMRSSCEIKYLKYLRNVNDDRTSQEVACASLDTSSNFFEDSIILFVWREFQNQKSNYSKHNCLKRHLFYNIFHRCDRIICKLLRIANTHISKCRCTIRYISISINERTSRSTSNQSVCQRSQNRCDQRQCEDVRLVLEIV